MLSKIFVAKKFLGILTLCGLLFIGMTACSSAKSKNNEKYKTSKNSPSLEMPPNLIAPTKDTEFAIPDVSKERMRVLLAGGKGVKLEKDGRIRWLVINHNPAEVWKNLVKFWETHKIPLAHHDDKIGLMETDWVLRQDKMPNGVETKDKYRIRLEADPMDNKVELFLSHRAMSKPPVENQAEKQDDKQTRGKILPADYELEVEMLQKILIFMGLSDDLAAKVLAAPVDVGVKAETIQRQSASPIMKVHATFPVVWRRLGLAIDHAGFDILKQDVKKKEFFIRVQKNEQRTLAGAEITLRLKEQDKYTEVSLVGTVSKLKIPERVKIINLLKNYFS